MSSAWHAGVDEAGRGPLAGPVVAAAVVLDPLRPVAGLRDSKRLSARQRERLAPQIRAQARSFAIGVCSVREIDALNILQASLLAMRRALEQLARVPERIMIDGNQRPQLDDRYALSTVEMIVGGDDIEPAISAASILAKVHRDALMLELDGRFPGYGFAFHQGYPVRAHLEALHRLGPCPEHRCSFRPVRDLLPGF